MKTYDNKICFHKHLLYMIHEVQKFKNQNDRRVRVYFSLQLYHVFENRITV